MANLNFKYGLHKSLPGDLNPGTIYVTTDEKAMYIDLPTDKNNPTTTVKRMRLGDIIIKDSTKDAKPPFAEGAIYYFIQENALVRWNGKSWTQINSLSSVEADIGQVSTTLNNEISRSTNKDTEHDNAIAGLNTAVSQRVTVSDFNTFKESNTTAIADAKKAGTDAQSTANTAVANAATAQSTANTAVSNAATAQSTADQAVLDAAAALAQANTMLPLAGGTMIGKITMSGNDAIITGLKTPSTNSDAANKKYVDDKASGLLGTENTSGNTIYGAKKDAAAAQSTANTAVANAATAQSTANTAVANAATAQTQADKGVADAAAALAQANTMLPKSGGTMTGAIAMGSNKITGLATPSSANDAANKTYVDAAEARASAVGSAAQTTANNAKSTAEAALPKSGGTMTGAINMGSNKITSSATPLSENDLTNKTYVDTAIANGIKTNDAMTFKGTLGTGGTITALPTSSGSTYSSSTDSALNGTKPQKGDTFKVAVKHTYLGSTEAKVGDLYINSGDDDGTPSWIHVSSGYEDDYLQKLIVNNSIIYLTDGVSNTTTGAVSGLQITGAIDSNIKFTVAAGTGEKPTHTVTANLEWGTF